MHADKARAHERVDWVFALLGELFGALPVPSRHRELLQVHLEVGREQVTARPEMSAAQLPLLVHAAITGEERPALPVAAACTLLYLGADLFDNLLDNELPAFWLTRGSEEANLAAVTLLAALPQLSMARLREQGTPPERLWALTQLFAESLLVMSSGQYEDLLSSEENVALGDYLTMVERKSGSEFALFTRAGAILATEKSSTIEDYAAFGSNLGIANQLVSDVWDIWGGGTSQDLLNGKQTLPIVYALSILRREKRERLRELLAAARESAEYHDEVRALLASAGSVRYTALIVWLHQQRARNHLTAASPRGPAGRGLQMMLDRASLTPQPK